MADPGFLRWGRQLKRGVCQYIIFTILSQKLLIYQIEQNWTERVRASLAPPWISHCIIAQVCRILWSDTQEMADWRIGGYTISMWIDWYKNSSEFVTTVTLYAMRVSAASGSRSPCRYFLPPIISSQSSVQHDNICYVEESENIYCWITRWLDGFQAAQLLRYFPRKQTHTANLIM